MNDDKHRQIVVVNNCELEINHRRHEVRFLTYGHDWDVAAKAAIYLREEGFLGDDDSQPWSIHPPEDLFPF